jgi:hypothetical protein
VTAARRTRRRSTRPLRAYRPRHELEWLTELWQMDDGFEVVQAIYRAVKRGHHRQPTGDILARQSYLRRISAAFHRRLHANAIFVEGANP